MEIFGAGGSCCCCDTRLLPQLPLRFSSSSSSSSAANNNNLLLRSGSGSGSGSHTTPLPPLNPKPFYNSSRKTKTLTTTRSLLNDDAAATSSSVKVNEVDPFLAAKNKAVDISPDLKGTSIFLVGISSTIKTKLGKLLAEAFRYYFFDSDSLIEEAAGSESSSAKSFRERDEKGFRELETEVLKQLSAMGRLVVAAGNGAVQTSTNLALLRHGISVWIDVPLDLVVREILEDGVQLPASEISTSGSYSEVNTQVTQLYKEMKGGYATADATVSLQKVASQLGYDDFNAVSMEDMCLEVENMYCSQGNRKIDEGKEADGRGCKTILDTMDMPRQH